MSVVGIEAMNLFAGTTVVDVTKLAKYRNLDMSRFENLLMKEKSIALPYEDPITFAVNAAKPLIDNLTEQEKDRIEMVITCTESSFDFSKSMSTYCHDLLGLNRNCRLIELKNACYSGVAGLQMAINFVLAQTSPGAKVLVLATDIARFMIDEADLAGEGSAVEADWSFAEPSSGAGAVAMIVSDQPHILQIDVGANGYYGYEVMDTCRPTANGEAGDSDVSLLSYLDCCHNAFLQYQKRVPDTDFINTFDYLAYHTPFGGMVKGAHRNLTRKLIKATPADIEADFNRRVIPGLNYCQRVGNIMGATAMLSVASAIDNGEYPQPKRIGIFSYGSGCCSEFFSGVVNQQAQQALAKLDIKGHLDRRVELTMAEYDSILVRSSELKFGTKDLVLDSSFIRRARTGQGRPVLFLKEIKEFHRVYEWVE